MRFILMTLMLLLSNDLLANKIKVQSDQKQTIESIFSVKFEKLRRDHCDDDPQDEDWVCTQEQLGRDSDLLGRGCSGDTAWACFTEFKEECVERYSGKSHSRTYTNFDGCFPNLSDCF